jgi:rhomboid protease GluP
MSQIEPPLDPARYPRQSAPPQTRPPPPQPHPDTFCTYLARQFIAKKGFDVARAPELARLYQFCEIVLTRSDGCGFDILCMVDRDARPDARFSMAIADLRAIGQACLKYRGKLDGRMMPLTITVMEVGPTSPDQKRRLRAIRRASPVAKVLPSAMVVNPFSGEVWSNGGSWLARAPYHGFAKKIARAPREPELDIAPPVMPAAPSSFPAVTTAMLVLLAAVFAAEIIFGIGPWTRLLQPSVETLTTFGALSRDAVSRGEWHRLLAAPLLHADAVRLVIDGIALFIAGRTLERLIGHAWFGVVYLLGALAGSLMTLALDPATIGSAGASGAIMGLFAAMLVVSLHFSSAAVRITLQNDALFVLIAVLLPLAGVVKGDRFDYAAYLGGAIGGAAIGYVLLFTWSDKDPLPRFRQAAAAIAAAAVLSLAYPAFAVVHDYRKATFATQLIPPDKIPRSSADMKARGEELFAQYPRDPRLRFQRAADLLNANDLAGAEREARAGLADEDLWQSLLPQIGNGLRVMLALAINPDRPEEAKAAARPACATMSDSPMRRLLVQQKLCGS